MGPTYQIVLSSTAQDNLRDIYDYLYDHVSFETAEHVKDGLEAEIAKLSQSPEANGLLQGHSSKTVYRRVLKWSYRIIFTVEENSWSWRSSALIVRRRTPPAWRTYPKQNPAHAAQTKNR